MKRGCLWGIALLLFPFFYLTAFTLVSEFLRSLAYKLFWN